MTGRRASALLLLAAGALVGCGPKEPPAAPPAPIESAAQKIQSSDNIPPDVRQRVAAGIAAAKAKK